MEVIPLAQPLKYLRCNNCQKIMILNGEKLVDKRGNNRGEIITLIICVDCADHFGSKLNDRY
jgi:hypothetical protein